MRKQEMIKEHKVRVHSMRFPEGKIKMMPTPEYLQSIRTSRKTISNSQIDKSETIKRLKIDVRLIASGKPAQRSLKRFGGYRNH